MESAADVHSPAAGKRARSRGLALAVLAGLALGACGDASPGGGSPSGSAGPATAKLTLAGDSGVSGTAKVIAVRCFEPSFDGEAIAVAAQAPGGQLFLAVSLRPGTISVRLSAGQGASFVERDFKGSGVTGFDAAHGAGISSQLSDSTPAGARSAGVGALTSISGSVDCAGQQPGTSALTVTNNGIRGNSSTLTPPGNIARNPLISPDTARMFSSSLKLKSLVGRAYAKSIAVRSFSTW